MTEVLNKFKQLDAVVKLIIINTLLFLMVYLGAFFFGVSQATLVQWFVLPEALPAFIKQPWSLLTYSFLHFGFWHLFWNMFVLYWFGTFFLNLFTSKRFFTVYFLGALVGGIVYILAYNIFPVFNKVNATLLGASAAVRAIMIFIATYTPSTQVRVFVFNIKLWHIGVFVVVTDLLQIPSGNAGGMLAHLGGALFGFIYARQLQKGNDIGVWFEDLISGVLQLFSPKSKKPFKKVHRTPNNKRTTRKKTNTSKDTHQQKVDAILDKIGKSGYESLTKAEKDYLFKAGKE